MTAPPIPEAPVGARRLGTFGGVFTPSILTILGVIMYLRFGWVVGNVGLAGALIIVALAHVISFATGLSVSSIATNRTVGAGGAYYMISRSLGAPAGAAVGIPLFFAQALSVTFYVVGFTESLDYFFRSIGFAPQDPTLSFLLDPRVLGTVTCAAMALVAMKSAEAALKVQYVVMAAIILSLVSFAAGSSSAAPENIQWWATEPDSASFAVVFAVFFPAVTGIMAGVSMSGDLKDARRSLPRGTLFAILAGLIVYTLFPILLSMNADNRTLIDRKDFIFDMAALPFAIFLGVWGATLSSAVGSILAAPRTLQALAADRLAPRWFAKGHGPANEPRRGLFFTFALAEVGVLLGSLDIIAPILTMFFLATYGVTNLACALEGWAANPSFRPTFRVPWWVSFGGFAACFYVMSIIDLGAMLAAAGICVGIYVYTQRRSLNVAFGDARHGIWSALVRTALRHLHRSEFHPMNWRPNLVVFGGEVERRRHLLELGSIIVQETGIVSYVQMLEGDVAALAEHRRRLNITTGHELGARYQNVFFRADIVPEVYGGVVTVAQSYGIGALEANTVMLGWLGKRERCGGYFKMLGELNDLGNSLLLYHDCPERDRGMRRHVQIWWGGLQANGALMLLVAWLITAHPRWRGANVSAVTVVDDEAHKQVAELGLAKILESARLDAEPRVLLRRGRDIREVMREESQRADLALLGLRLPEAGEDKEALFESYQAILAELPSTLLVHSGLDFEGAPVLFDE